MDKVLTNPRLKLLLSVVAGVLWLGWCLAALKIPVVRDVRVASPVGNSPWGAPPLALSFPPLALAPLFLIQLSATWALGWLGLRAFFQTPSPAETPRPFTQALIYAALFLPGYLGWVAIHRIISLVFPNGLAMPLCWLAQLGVIGFAARSIKWRTSGLGALALTAVGLAFWLLFQIQFSFVHVTGDAFLFILQILGAPLEKGPLDPWHRFPRFKLHYDELMYWYPSLSWYQGAASRNAFGLWWLAGAAGKLSAFSLTALASARLLRAQPHSLAWGVLIAVFLFFGTHFIDPRTSFILFDSSNPGANLLHNGRLIHAFLALWMLALVDLELKPFSSQLSRFAFAALAIGLSATTLPHLLTIAFLPLFILDRDNANATRPWILLSPVLLIPVAFWFMYPDQAGGPQTSGSLIWVALALCGGFWIPAVLKGLSAESFSPRAFFSSDAFRWGWAPLLLGHLILGNLLAVQIPVLLPTLVDRILGDSVTAPLGLMRSNLCSQWPTWHCMTRWHLVGHFGFPIALIAGVLLSFYKGTSWLRRSATWLLIGLTGALFAYDWINPTLSSPAHFWVKSRLPEPFFYGLIGASILLLIQQGRLGKWTAGLLIAAYTLGPLVLDWQHSVLRQLLINVSYLVAL